MKDKITNYKLSAYGEISPENKTGGQITNNIQYQIPKFQIKSKESRAENREPRTKNGFTLLELLIAVSIVVFIVVSVYASISLISNIEGSVNKSVDFYQTANLALQIICADISSAFISLENEKLIFLGSDGGSGDSAADEIEFFALIDEEFSPGYMVPVLKRIKYYLEEDKLMRMETGMIAKGLEDEEGNSFELCEGVFGIDFEYYDGENWQTNWDSDRIRERENEEKTGTIRSKRKPDWTNKLLPRIVKITLYMESNNTEEEDSVLEFSSAVYLLRSGLGREE
jgi:type II secretion system protein J